jgi:Cof subfamily protein (haloacid dehalogenase superfamily)
MAAHRADREQMNSIAALISDVDGTVMTHAKTLTPRTCQAAAELKARGIPFAVISARPPRGMRMMVEPLGLTFPLAGFNGGQFTRPDLTPIEDYAIAPETAHRAYELLATKGVDVWVFDGSDWKIRNPDGAHVAHEKGTIQYDPIVVKDFEQSLLAAHKIVGVSDDHALLARVEAEMQAALGNAANVARSQTYYLDITHPQANKGAGVRRLAALMGVPMENIAVIGDGHNDVAMFEQTKFSIAMGNAADDVKKQARFVTASNEEDGFAAAVEKYVLGAAL